MHCMSSLLAQSGHSLVHCTCPLLGVKRTWRFALQMSACDPKADTGSTENPTVNAAGKYRISKFQTLDGRSTIVGR